MKLLIIIILVTLSSIVCRSQTNIFLKSDSLKFNLKTSDLFSYKVPKDYSVPILNYSFEPGNSTSRYSFYNYSLNKSIGYDNRKHVYLDPEFPYRGFIKGKLSYLLLLLDNK